MTEAAFEKQSKEIKEIIRRTAVPAGSGRPLVGARESRARGSRSRKRCNSRLARNVSSRRLAKSAPNVFVATHGLDSPYRFTLFDFD
jgi:hypothetical protein